MTRPLFVGIGPVLMDQFVHCDRLPVDIELPGPGSKLEARDSGHMRRVREEWVEGWSYISQVGGPVQVALRQAAQLGANVRFVGSVGDDHTGQFLQREMILQGFDRNDVVVEPGRRSGSAIVWIDRDGERSILFDKGTLAPVPRNCADALIAANPDRVFIDSREFEAAHRLASLAVDRGIPVHYDIDPWVPWTSELLAVSHVAQVSYRSALENSPYDGSPAAIAKAILDDSPLELAIVTNSDKGLYAEGRDGLSLHVPGADVEGVDSTGAGDVFAGAYEMARFRGEPIVNALRFGAATAAEHVTRLGNGVLPDETGIELRLMEMGRD